MRINEQQAQEIAKILVDLDIQTLGDYLVELRTDRVIIVSGTPIAKWRDAVSRQLEHRLNAVESFIVKHFGDPPYNP